MAISNVKNLQIGSKPAVGITMIKLFMIPLITQCRMLRLELFVKLSVTILMKQAKLGVQHSKSKLSGPDQNVI